MGTLATVVEPTEGGAAPMDARGGVRWVRKIGEYTFPATYASGGDTVPLPDAPPGGTLRCVSIVHAATPAGIDVRWDGDTAEPELLAYDEDNTSGVAAELANGNGQLDGLVVILEFLYRVGA